MKPSDSKTNRAARQRRSRARKALKKAGTAIPAELAPIPPQAPDTPLERVIRDAANARAAETRKAAKRPPLTVTTCDSDGQRKTERIAVPEPRPVPPPVCAAPVITPPTKLRGEGDPTVRRVLIQRPGSNRKEWCDPAAIPPGSQRFEHRQTEKSGSICRPSSGYNAHGFADPYGTVGQNMHSENSASSNIFGWTAP